MAVAMGGFTGYILLSQSSTSENLAQYDKQIASLQNEVVKYESNNMEAALSAKEALNTLQGDYIKWSDVIEKILSTTPKDPKTRVPLVEYVSYSGSQNSNISINVKTIPGSESPFTDVASLIRSFNSSKYFENAFVPSISTGFSDTDDMVLTFNFNVKLKPSK